ncbi:major tail protein [Aeribacillus composti]|uniref:major tail protein n=1 Tax=Aeribacillus composti TaxID=1868734 RepID=UPI00406A8FE6
MGKVIHGLDMFHIAKLTSDSRDAEPVYATPEPVPGAVNVSVNPQTESNTFYADNGAYAVLNSMGDIEVTIGVADLPLSLQKEIFGHQEENGVQFASINDNISEIALGFRSKVSTGGYRYYWFLKGKPQLVPIEGQTDEANANPQTANLTIRFMPLEYNGRWKAQAEDGTEFTQGNKWFDQVVYKGTVFAGV